MNQKNERRGALRHDVMWPAIVSNVPSSGHNFSETVTIENLSSSGAYFYFKTMIKIGDLLDLRIDIGHMVTKVLAYVVRTEKRENGYGIGVCFKSAFTCSEPIVIE